MHVVILAGARDAGGFGTRWFSSLPASRTQRLLQWRTLCDSGQQTHLAAFKGLVLLRAVLCQQQLPELKDKIPRNSMTA